MFALGILAVLFFMTFLAGLFRWQLDIGDVVFAGVSGSVTIGTIGPGLAHGPAEKILDDSGGNSVYSSRTNT